MHKETTEMRLTNSLASGGGCAGYDGNKRKEKVTYRMVGPGGLRQGVCFCFIWMESVFPYGDKM